MKTFVLRLLVTLITLYGLGAVAYGLLHYAPGERPDVGGILGDYTRDLGALFCRSSSEPARPPSSLAPTPDTPGQPPPERDGLAELADDLSLSLALSRVHVPDSARLSAAAAEQWDTLRPIHAQLLPESLAELARLRALASTDKVAFGRDRAAARARLAAARATLLPPTQAQPPMDAAVKLLEILDRLDAALAGI